MKVVQHVDQMLTVELLITVLLAPVPVDSQEILPQMLVVFVFLLAVPLKQIVLQVNTVPMENAKVGNVSLPNNVCKACFYFVTSNFLSSLQFCVAQIEIAFRMNNVSVEDVMYNAVVTETVRHKKYVSNIAVKVRFFYNFKLSSNTFFFFHLFNLKMFFL